MKKLRRIGLLALLLVAGVVLWFARDWYWQHNLHTVVRGELYRSAQMNAAQLGKTIDRLHIESVINLRGENSGQAWYQQELAVCQDKQVAHFDVRLGAKKMPTPAQLDDLIHLYDTAPRPILVHCYSGADRAGFAAALYLLVERDMPSRKADREALSLRFGHLQWFGYEESDEFYSFYQKSKQTDFKTWAAQTYPNIYQVEKIENQWRN